MMNTIERYKARWVVHGFMEILDEHFSPDSTHAPVASDSSLLVMMSLVAIRVLKIKQMDAKSAFLNSPLIHDVWVRFPDGYVHSLGHSFTKLCKSLYGPKQAAADWKQPSWIQSAQQMLRCVLLYPLTHVDVSITMLCSLQANTHTGYIYRNTLYERICFGGPEVPIPQSVHMPTVLNE
eukprot:CAMPEP_0114245730 /NCGR_PEP_ID=MMETSP0058-20121206/12063_1 /TAXON_ID=36894 /ORGANISM="Pyramimonas parkeae, CCMP726" /LENGTH=178 /DNA_ID=CAMNT_0001358825 /DNA_START=989 /DNA_END=1525 /DNA_ORIENTATION=-